MKKVFIQIMKAAGYIGLFLLVQIVFMIPAIFIYMASKGNVSYNDVIQDTDFLTVFSGVCDVVCVIIIVLISVIKGEKIKDSLYLNTVSGKNVLLIILGGFCTAQFVTFMFQLLPLFSDGITDVMEGYSEYMESNYSGNVFIYLPIAVLIAPISEEVLLRGRVYTNLTEVMPDALAVIITSLIFGVLHGHPVQIIYAAVLGSIMNIVFIRCNSLYASILMHMSFNLLGSFSVQSDSLIFLLIGSVVTLTGIIFSLTAIGKNTKRQIMT